MIIYTCPKCGGDVYHTCICTMSPIDVWECLDCDWKYEKKTALNIAHLSQLKPNSMKIGQYMRILKISC